MRVDPRTGLPALTAPATTRRADGAAHFSLGAEAGAARAGASAGTAGAATLAGLDAVLMLQTETDTPQERRRRSVRRGHDLLDGLDRLKAALLGGRVAVRDLRAIAGRLGERGTESGDPRLDGLMAEIELRAAVELAKLEMRPGA